MAPAVHVDRYLERIGYSGPREPTLVVLEALQAAHSGAIPFENISVVLGHPVDVDSAAVEDKLVALRRGGYCLEQNRLFADVLGSIGFSLTEVLARARPPGLEVVAPRIHMALCVHIDGVDWLADVGFGAEQPRVPVRLDGTARDDGWGGVRVVEERKSELVLQRSASDGWHDLYTFDFEPVFPMDYVVANHFARTHPAAPFAGDLTLQLAAADARHVLLRGEYRMYVADRVVREPLDPALLSRLLDEVMPIELAPDDRRALFDRVFGGPC
ncbi:MAG: arylamine N-acetyltransferase [Actinomycetota bacterium]